VAVREARVDPVARHEQPRLDPQIRRREAEPAASRVTRDDRSLELGRTAEEPRRAPDLARAQERTNLGRRNALDERNRPGVEAEPREQLEIAAPLASEAKGPAGDDDLGADRTKVRLGEFLGLELRQIGGELDRERLLDAEVGEQLESPLERGQ
jgi:hypothetical protein